MVKNYISLRDVDCTDGNLNKLWKKHIMSATFTGSVRKFNEISQD